MGNARLPARQIAGMDPLAFIALMVFTVALICWGVNSGGDPADPVDVPSQSQTEEPRP